MDKEDQNPDSVNPTPDTPEVEEGVDSGRRNFAKKASVAVAVVMTVANRPTMAGGSWGGGGGHHGGGGGWGGTTTTGKYDKGCTISAWMSAGSGPVTMKCGGKDCNYWCNKYDKTNYNCWPRPHLSSGGCDGYAYPTQWPGWDYKHDYTPTFQSICGSYPLEQVKDRYGHTISNPTVCDVLKDDRYGTKLQSQFCAALLNAADSTCNYGYSVTDIVKLYKDNCSTNPVGLYSMLKTLNSRS